MRVCSVSYLNSIPFVYGIENSHLEVELSTAIPSQCASKLLNDDVDIALVPVAILPQLKQSNMISSFCIASNGKVETVCLFSQVPLGQIDTIILDYHSRTSNELIQQLCRYFWKITPRFVYSNAEFSTRIKGQTAGLIIGDRAYQYRSQFAYVYDLSEEWKKWTDLPFVFACWVSNKNIDPSFEEAFCQALQYGVLHLPQAISEKGQLFETSIDKERYLTQVIDYQLDELKRTALKLFLKGIS